MLPEATFSKMLSINNEHNIDDSSTRSPRASEEIADIRNCNSVPFLIQSKFKVTDIEIGLVKSTTKQVELTLGYCSVEED